MQFYKPNRKNTGAGIDFQVDLFEKKSIRIKFIKQHTWVDASGGKKGYGTFKGNDGNPAANFEMKLSVVEACGLMRCLSKWKEYLCDSTQNNHIKHFFEQSQTTLRVEPIKRGEAHVMSFSASRKQDSDSSWVTIGVLLGPNENRQLTEWLQWAINTIWTADFQRRCLAFEERGRQLRKERPTNDVFDGASVKVESSAESDGHLPPVDEPPSTADMNDDDPF